MDGTVRPGGFRVVLSPLVGGNDLVASGRAQPFEADERRLPIRSLRAERVLMDTTVGVASWWQFGSRQQLSLLTRGLSEQCGQNDPAD